MLAYGSSMTSTCRGNVLVTVSSLAFSYSTVSVRLSVPPCVGVKARPMVPLLPDSRLPTFCTGVSVWMPSPEMLTATLDTADLPLLT